MENLLWVSWKQLGTLQWGHITLMALPMQECGNSSGVYHNLALSHQGHQYHLLLQGEPFVVVLTRSLSDLTRRRSRHSQLTTTCNRSYATNGNQAHMTSSRAPTSVVSDQTNLASQKARQRQPGCHLEAAMMAGRVALWKLLLEVWRHSGFLYPSIIFHIFNSLVCGRCHNFKCVFLFRFITMIAILNISCEFFWQRDATGPHWWYR